MRCAPALALLSSRPLPLPLPRGGRCPQRCRMLRYTSTFGLIIFSVALLILSFISFVSIKKDVNPRYGPNGGPRMYMFHAGFRSERTNLLAAVGGSGHE
ncbi:Sia-alpha-2,3-Gal-beta-1,4-GlcNAc-R:alpha 2,8-sialyltransferase [Oryzias melastigma]|uniref:Sia-alpha-2,3-Gal-beta-1,4-GlcNAc-R:alpha 2,8-sialyltransferase n=1 Tax=Oryzias melastigma TaxID=30732 RepID=A0A834FDW4_ORYME|nr:Sia-alpha-2,3-Gal-beta-1,4-GlcNAc-R:alpha 2,8-sialyltransferase [Oryzias melastigma]